MLYHSTMVDVDGGGEVRTSIGSRQRHVRHITNKSFVGRLADRQDSPYPGTRHPKLKVVFFNISKIGPKYLASTSSQLRESKDGESKTTRHTFDKYHLQPDLTASY